MELLDVTVEIFQPLEGSSFTVNGGEAGTLALTDVQSKPGLASIERTPFCLTFTGEGELLPQGIYRLEHDACGVLEIFLVPVSEGESGVLYEAVFS
jgi:Domain of unknown function (DUF6916)